MQKSKNLRNELVIQGSRIGVWDWNIQTGETYFNERWAEIIGYTIEELMPLSIQTWVQFAHPEDLIESNFLLEKHFKGESEYYDFHSRMKHKNGHWIWVHDRGKVFEWDKLGKPLRMCGSHIDITAQKELEINLKQALKDREILLKEVHHRVKNNLQILLSIMRLKSMNGFVKTQEIEDSIYTIARTYEAIYKSDELDKISIKNYFNQIIQPISKPLDIQFVLNIDDFDTSIDFLIPLGLVLNELINNSIKHAFQSKQKNEKKSIHITVSKTTTFITIHYSDDGIGFPINILEQVRTIDSFGISIIKGLIEQINGNIEFYNNEGANTLIKINI